MEHLENAIGFYTVAYYSGLLNFDMHDAINAVSNYAAAWVANLIER